jgi:alpha-galactosidase
MKALSLLSVLLLFVLAGCTNSKNPDILCKNPPMGYNSYDSYNSILNQEIAVKLIDVMAEKYLPFGYEYFVIDAGWYTEYKIDPETRLPLASDSKRRFNIDENGLPEPSKVYFSNGIKALADYAHKKGLKFGLHLMRGALKQAAEQNCLVKGTTIPIRDITDSLSICTWASFTIGVNMDKPGANEYYYSMIKKMASWNVDFIKYDDITGMPDEINAIVKAIKNCGRPIVLSLSPGEDTKIEFLPFYEKCNMLRITADIWDYPRSLNNGFTAMKNYQGRGVPGFWPDLDMIALGPLEVLKKTKRRSRFNNDQALTFITQRAIFASPLIIGGDMLTMDDLTYKLLTNKEMITCNQNGVTGVLTFDADSIEIYNAVNKNDPGKGWLAVFNRKHLPDTIIVDKSDFGFYYNRKRLNVLLKNYQLHDIWNQKDYSLTDSLDLRIPANGVMFASFSEY